MTGPTLVTGATGFAGSHLLDLFAADGIELVGWHRPGGQPPVDAAGVRWQPVDLLDSTAVAAAIAAIRPSVVYHCGGAAHVGQSWDTTTRTLEVNVLGTHHLVEALRKHAPAAAILITSSALVYGSSTDAIDETRPLAPSSPYGLSKLAQELVGADNGGAPTVHIARPFNHFGPRQSSTFVSAAFARQLAEIEAGLRPPVIQVGNLDARRDLTDVRDTVRAYRQIMERGRAGRPYNVCTGRALAVREVLEALVSHARVPVTIAIDPSRFRPNDIPVVLGDPTRTRTELGWVPAIPLSQTAADLLEYWRARIRSS